ncbi:DUF6933 domain-containing protein [Nonlabens xiamenensis]|uniref:DUF6933 domain-containing protein n=1 Tax=Nonlabens xiamenensis TaxID=2341043 RepID=UPI000F604A81|nr:hypothetical protein [Nonlabens xiamenensis]
MMNIHCFKMFENFYNISISDKSFDISESSWTAHKFKVEQKDCAIFLHHKSLFSVVIFEFTKNMISDLKYNFTKSTIEHLEKDIHLRDDEKNIIIDEICDFNFTSKFNSKLVNNLITNYIKVIKGLKLLHDPIFPDKNTMEVCYWSNECFNDINNCLDFKEAILKRKLANC